MDGSDLLKKNVFRASEEMSGVAVRGYDFNQGVDYAQLIANFSATGMQATHLSRAIAITQKMVEENAFVYLGYTSSMVSSGLREIFRWLVEHKKVNVVVTTAGGIEEDIIKCLGDFYIGDFTASGSELREKGINRIGNILVPNNRYVAFEAFIQPILLQLYEEQKKTGIPITPSELIWKLGEAIGNPASICYWAWKNNIRIFCPALQDGALGDNIYFFSLNHPGFVIDLVRDSELLYNTSIGLTKSGVILLGAGVVKHQILNTNMLRNGADYSVYINTAQEFDGSDAGALPDEAVSWGKLTAGGESVKVFADATIVFPLLVAETFAKK